MNRNYAKREDSPNATHYCADDETLVRVLEAARTSAGAIAHRVVRNWHTAEDVVQEALLRAVVAQDHLQQIDNLEAWFRGVVRNIAVDRVRREVREREIMEALSAAGAFDDLIPHQQTETLEQEELRDLIREAMSQLNAHNRRVIDLFYLKNQTLKQVADCLGVSPNTVKQRLFRARDMLKSVLVTLSLDAYSVQTQRTRKAIIMKTEQQQKTVSATHAIPPGWHLFGTTGYTVRGDTEHHLMGVASVTIKAERHEADQTAGVMQRFPAGQWRGRRLLARLWAKGVGLDESGFHGFLEAHDRNDVGYNVIWPKCGGTFDWQAIETVIDVPDTDCLLTVGFQLIGPGQVWLGRIELEEAPAGALPNDVRHSITWPGLANLDFSDTSKVLPATGRMLGLAPGWFQVGFGPHDSIYSLDRKLLQTGVASACIDHRQIPSQGLSRIYQRVPVEKAWRGRHLRMRGWIKTDGADRAGLWFRTDVGNECTHLDDMKDRPIEGTREWTPYDLVVAIMPEATHVAFGALLHGQGAIWLDRLEFEVVSPDVFATAECLAPEQLPFLPRTTQTNDKACNLDFAETPLNMT